MARKVLLQTVVGPCRQVDIHKERTGSGRRAGVFERRPLYVNVMFPTSHHTQESPQVLRLDTGSWVSAIPAQWLDGLPRRRPWGRNEGADARENRKHEWGYAHQAWAGDKRPRLERIGPVLCLLVARDRKDDIAIELPFFVMEQQHVPEAVLGVMGLLAPETVHFDNGHEKKLDSRILELRIKQYVYGQTGDCQCEVSVFVDDGGGNGQ